MTICYMLLYHDAMREAARARARPFQGARQAEKRREIRRQPKETAKPARHETRLGAKYCTPEINTPEIIVGAQWYFPMDGQWHFPMECHVCDFWCVICCPEIMAKWGFYERGVDNVRKQSACTLSE